MLSVFSHRFHRFTQKLGCLQGDALCCCGGKDTSATIFRTQRICVDLCNLWEALLSSRFCGFCAICGRTTVCSVGALLALASGKAERRQVHPLKLQSVEVTLLLRRQDTSATIFRTQRICVNLWEALLSRRFCEFRAICGRTTVCLVGALETSAPPEIAIC